MLKFILVAMLAIAPVAMAQVSDGLKLENKANPVIKITTDKGEMVLELFPEVAPKHVESMLKLIRDGFYNGLAFHRVVPGFVIQGGCPNSKEGATGMPGTGGPGYNLPAEFNARKHLKGTLAMARSNDPNSAGSQFYICLDAIPHLDNQYTVFGQLVLGHDVPEKIKQNDRMQISIVQDLIAPATASSTATSGK